jgi:hypothetical protein
VRARVTIVAALLALLPAAPLLGADLPPGHQSVLLLRTLAYDRNLKARAGTQLTIAVVFNADDEVSELAQADMVASLRESAESLLVSGLPVRVLSVPYHDAAALDATLTLAHAGAVYLCPGLTQVAQIFSITRRRAILSTTGTARYLASGIGIGFVSRDDRSVLVVNLTAVRAEGASFAAALLRFAELIKEPESK